MIATSFAGKLLIQKDKHNNKRQSNGSGEVLCRVCNVKGMVSIIYVIIIRRGLRQEWGPVVLATV